MLGPRFARQDAIYPLIGGSILLAFGTFHIRRSFSICFVGTRSLRVFERTKVCNSNYCYL
jgi:hypothetical protein